MKSVLPSGGEGKDWPDFYKQKRFFYKKHTSDIFSFLILKWFHYLYNATPRRTAKMPVAKAKNNATNTW